MQIAIIGAGGVGGYYGGVLAMHGHEVRILARGAHLDAIRARGLEVRTPDGTFVAHPEAISEPSDLAGAELVVVAVKGYALAEVAPAVRAAAEPAGTVLPLLNGIGITERLAALGVRASAMLDGLTYISAVRAEPGVVQRFSPFQRIVIGEPGGGTSERVRRIVDVFHEAGMDARASERIAVELWQKLIFIATVAAVCALSRSPIGAVRDAPLSDRLIGRAIDEAIRVANASGVALPAGEDTRVRGLIDGLPATMKPSLLVDLERGGPTEIDILSGAIAELGRRLGIETPVHDAAITAVLAATGGP